MTDAYSIIERNSVVYTISLVAEFAKHKLYLTKPSVLDVLLVMALMCSFQDKSDDM